MEMCIKMLRYSFFSKEYSNCTKEQAVEFLKKTDKPLKYTYGLEYRGPTIHKVPISKEDACEKMMKESYIDVDEYEDYVHINAFSSNDLF